MGRTKTRQREWRKQMRKRGQRPPRKSYTWDCMSPGGRANRTRRITREEPCTWDTPNAAREREQIRKMEKAMDGVGWTALVIAGLIALVVIYVQCGKYFYG